MNLSRFNDQGIARFQEYLGNLRRNPSSDGPWELVEDSSISETVSDSHQIPTDQTFSTRREMVEFLEPRLNDVFNGDDMEDTGLWAWIAATLFDTVCPVGRDGTRAPGRDYRHIPSEDWRHFYRHLVRGPIRIFRLFRESPQSADIVLCQHPSTPGEFVEQLAARQERITNPAIIEAANRLYFDESRMKPKRGSTPTSPKPGSLRRFGHLLNQLDLTYDLYSMSTEDLLSLLPDEFRQYDA